MLQLYQARSAGIHTFKRKIGHGLIGDCRIFVIMTLDRRETMPRKAAPVRVVPQDPVLAPKLCI